MIRVLLLLVIVLFAPRVEANEITGAATAVDSTVIAINGQRIMLFGVDSVMRKQTCAIGGKIWQCWPAALRNLEILLDQGPVTCETVGEPDVYGRLLARCNVNGESLNDSWSVRAGQSQGPARRPTMSPRKLRPRRKSSGFGGVSL
jgi:endonuclease YncB( thermonuclease family)